MPALFFLESIALRTCCSVVPVPERIEKCRRNSRDGANYRGRRDASQKHAWRAAVNLSSADGVGTNEIMRRTGKSKTCVWRWQERFMKEGIDGLLHDKTRPSRIPPLGPEVAARVVALTLADPPVETTHWTADLMARASGISASAVRRIWKAHGLQPHRYRQFKLTTS